MSRRKRAELERIEAQASAPDFWSDQEAAQKTAAATQPRCNERSSGKRNSKLRSPTPGCSLNLPKKTKLR